MDMKKFIMPVAGICGTVLIGVLLKKNPGVDVEKNIPNIAEKPEKNYGGIPLSKLDELAKQIYHGLSCTIDKWGFLVFHYKSNRGHQTFHDQMTLDDAGKLVNLGGHFPGQWWSGADEFAKRANEMFTFIK